MEQSAKTSAARAVRRTRLWYAALLLVIGLFTVRLFYLQIIRYDYYRKQALSDQLKQYVIPAPRGIIEAHDGDNVVPIVLNQTLYTIYADPSLIKNAQKAAADVASVTGGKADDYQKLMQQPTRFAVLVRKVSQAQSDKILGFKQPGIGTQAQNYRIYPQGTLAAQVLGFVNNDEQGKYGIEQALDSSLSGKPGELKAVTDVNGVPLAASGNNIQKNPTAGNNIVLTLNIAMQHQLEQILQQGVQHAQASSGSALIMDPNTGAIKAMANFPSYDPSNFSSVSDPNLFINSSVANPIEIGSIMKALTVSAALDQGVVHANTTYNDPSQWTIDGFKITNIEEDGGPGIKSIADILNLSLNTGATWLLMQMGGGQINQKARSTWHDYMVNHYQFGKPTGIEQGYEAPGTIPDPTNGYGLNLTYANTAFGQGMTATALQMGGALSSVLNGGIYYQPHLVDETVNASGKTTLMQPKVVKSGVISSGVSQDIIPLLQNVVQQHHIVPGFDQNTYTVGGKTGTAQIAKPGGGYLDKDFNGSYMGFVGGNKPQYVIIVFVNQPKIGGYAGTAAAQPIFANLAHMLINNSYVTPKI